MDHLITDDKLKDTLQSAEWREQLKYSLSTLTQYFPVLFSSRLIALLYYLSLLKSVHTLGFPGPFITVPYPGRHSEVFSEESIMHI